MKIKIERLDEPELQFNGTSNVYCKDGLATCNGPFDSISDSHSDRIILGLVAIKELISKTKDWVDLCNNNIESKPHGNKEVVNKKIFPDFPGCDLTFGAKLALTDSYIAPITLSDLSKIVYLNNYKYSEGLLSLINEKIEHILNVNEKKPSVILFALDDEMFERCHIVGDYHKKLKKKRKLDFEQLDLFRDLDLFEHKTGQESEPFYINFRSSLKKLMMKPNISIPIQILRQQTIDPHSEYTQNAATKAWNFSTGIYYKSGRHPWVLKDIDSDTCFLGISFYHKKDFYNDNLYTSMANLFSNDFDDIILRGKKVDYDEELEMPYLDYDKSKYIIEETLNYYNKLKGNKLPKRIIIHKTSEYREDEIKGFSELLENRGIIYDLVTLKKSSLRFIRFGQMPVPRGTYISIDDKKHFLYTKGYIPELQTYPGVHIPAPFEIIKARGDSSYKDLCKEVLALTKLNWNTADFCCGLPITVGFSRNVGQVLKQFEDSDKFDPQFSYRFYM